MDVIIEKSDQLASLLISSHFDRSGHRAVSYSIREVIRNTFEHSHSEVCYFCGQKYKDGSVELAIFDEGRGILPSLSEAYNLVEDAEGLRTVIKPGVSRMSDKDTRANIFGNSGFGLFVLSELGRCFGYFNLASGSANIKINSKAYTEGIQPELPGTFISLRFNNAPKSFSGTLDDIVSSGEAEALESGNITSASKLSRLSNDQV